MEAAADLIYAEGWQFFWLAWVLSATIGALFRCSWPTFQVALMLLAGWFLTNVFWQMPLVYLLSDSVFMVVAFGLWLQAREAHILTVAAIYAGMLLVNAVGPHFPDRMVILNALYAAQLTAISRAAYRGTPDPPGSEGI